MSLIPQYLDQIRTRVAADLGAGYKKLTNTYMVTENSENILTQGYGVSIGQGRDSSRQLDGTISIARNIIITVTRKFIAMDLNLTAKENAEKILLDDCYNVLKDFGHEPWLSQGSASMTFTGDTGIIPIFHDRGDYVKIAMTYNLEYFENI